MNQTKAALSIFIFLILLTLFQAAYYYPQMPEKVASSFNAQGEANGWMDKAGFMIFQIGLTLFLCATFLGVAFGMNYIPVSLVNLPNRDYWFAPERRKETLDFLKREMLWFSNATLVFMLAVFQLTYKANLEQESKLDNFFWLYMGLYLLYSIWWTVHFYRRFSKKNMEAAGGLN
jgi:uncharacterized membrane protein